MTDEQATPAPRDIPAELGGNPLSDEDVRRAEHPDEFTDEAAGSSSEDEEPAPAAPVTPAAGTGFEISGAVGGSVTAASGGATVYPPVTPPAPPAPPAPPEEPPTPPAPEPAPAGGILDTVSVESTLVPPPGAATREEELGILARMESDAKALRDRLFGDGGAL